MLCDVGVLMELGFIRKGNALYPMDEIQLDEMMKIPEGVALRVVVEVETKQRTGQQNKALHKYLAMLSKDLNRAGLDMRKTLKPEVEIPWTMENAKNYLWRPLMKAVTGKDSTRDMETTEVNEVYSVLSRHMADKHGITTPFPSRFGE